MLRSIRHWFRVLTYRDWTFILRLGKTRPLQEDDIPPLTEDYQPDAFADRYAAIPTTSRWSFVLGIGKALRGMLVLFVALALTIATLRLLETYFYKELIAAVAGLDGASDFWATIRDVAPAILAFALCSLGVTLSFQYYIHALVKGEVLITNGVNSRIYRHALRLSAKARQQKSVGDLVNIIGADTDKLAEFYSFVAELFYLLFITTVVFAFSYSLIGMSAIWGALVAIAITPIAFYTSQRFVHYDEAIMGKRDDRISLMSQILNGVRVVKYFGWEQHFAAEVDAVRHEEMVLRRKFVFVRVISSLIWSSSRIFGVILAIGLELANGRDLSAVWVFPLLSIYSHLIHPYSTLSSHIAEMSSGVVSAQRIIDFLNLPVRKVVREPLAPAFARAALDQPRDLPAAVLRLDELTIDYGEGPVIEGLNLSLRKGQKIAIVGKVGSGKTSLISTILGEQPAVAGAVQLAVDAKLGYSGQHGFIQTGTVAENIRFGAPAMASRDINSAVADAGMTDDLLQFADGIDTEIGENGINLSGGQKQRLSLARVAYADPDLILLDDPLSAVDPDMEDHLAEQLIWGRWQDKTIVMTSHRLGHLAKFDQVLFLTGDGEWHLDSYDGLLARHSEFRSWVEASARAEASREKHQRQLSATKVLAKSERKPSGVRAIDEEDRVEGTIGFDVYLSYLRRMGGRDAKRRPWVFGAMVFSLAVATVFPPIFNYWMSLLVSAKDGVITLPIVGELPWQDAWLVPSLIVLALCVVGSKGIQSIYWALRALIAGKNLHDEAFTQVTKAPVKFFDKNPVGRILNRFSKDVDVVENETSYTLENAIVSLALAVVGFGIVALAMPVSLLMLIPIGIALYGVQDLFRISARELKRMYSITRSPRFAHFKETLEGLATIRAFGSEEVFHQQYAQRLGNNQRMFMAIVFMNRWLCIRIPAQGFFYTLFVASLVVYFATEHGLSAAMAGFILLNCMSIWHYMSLFVREFKNLEAQMTSIERLNAYGEIAAEPDVVGEAYPHVASWQEGFGGAIAFEDVWLRYEPGLPDVLKGLSFAIEPGQKVGIIGRTGAGKSTVFSSLYRFVRPYKGRITMDGVDIDTLPIKTLRQQMAIIPQDPTLFRGTLRSNLDRFGSFTDDQVWQALTKVGLVEMVQGLPGQLAAEVVENGTNYSAGERQLLCLARAILLDTKIIILDEATASVDIITDEKIQRTIAAQFKGKTMLIIAHRLATVADCDLVMELKNGAVHRMMPGANRTGELPSSNTRLRAPTNAL